MSHSHGDVSKHIKVYVGIFVALLVFTAITVAVSELDVPIVTGVIIALVIASIKGYLVAAYFMHLVGEKKIIYASLLLTAVFFAFLIFIPLATFLDSTGH